MKINTWIKSTGIFVLCVAVAISLEARLDFESTAFAATAESGQGKVPFEFLFENSGDRPVEITEVRICCGSTMSELEQRLYQPGEGGVIEGSFTVGNRQGTHRQHVHVRTDNPEQPEVRLEVVVTIPQEVEISQRLVRWEINGDPEPRIVRLKPNLDLGVTISDVSVNSDAFVVDLLECDWDTHALDMLVAPLGTDREIRGAIKISTINKHGRARDLFIHAVVR